jgi:phage shock protein A
MKNELEFPCCTAICRRAILAADSEALMTLEELSKMDYRGAMEMLLAFSTDIKRYDRELEALEKDIALWSSRVALAEGKGLADLASGARAQVSNLESKRDTLKSERQGLEIDAQRLKEALPGIKARQRSIDPDRLQAELSMLTGEALDPDKAKLERELDSLDPAKTQAEDPLAALKKKMGL